MTAALRQANAIRTSAIGLSEPRLNQALNYRENQGG